MLYKRVAKSILLFLYSANFKANSFPLKLLNSLESVLNSATFSVLALVGQVKVFKPTPIDL